jgi:hypothetical protein
MEPIMIAGWYFSLLLSSYLLTWIWQSTGRSVLLVALFHGTVDIVVTTRASEGAISIAINMFLLLAGLLVVKLYAPELKARGTWSRRRLPMDRERASETSSVTS